MPTSLPLVFDPPRRAMPPRHLADLDEAGRVAAFTEVGLPAFLSKQLANQYYGRFIADPREMTDMPAAVREQVAEAMFPKLLDPVDDRLPGASGLAGAGLGGPGGAYVPIRRGRPPLPDGGVARPGA